jgi:hypothetical protein
MMYSQCSAHIIFVVLFSQSADITSPTHPSRTLFICYLPTYLLSAICFPLTQLSTTQGDAYLYTHLVQQLRSRDDPDTLFRVYLAMSSFVTRITSKYVLDAVMCGPQIDLLSIMGVCIYISILSTSIRRVQLHWAVCFVVLQSRCTRLTYLPHPPPCMCAVTTTLRPQMYRELIQSLYTFDWNMEDRVVVAFISLLAQVVSSNPIFLLPSLQMLVKNFLPSDAMVEEFSGGCDVCV